MSAHEPIYTPKALVAGDKGLLAMENGAATRVLAAQQGFYHRARYIRAGRRTASCTCTKTSSTPACWSSLKPEAGFAGCGAGRPRTAQQV